MRRMLIIPDGAADYPIASLKNRTPLQAARIPNLDRLAREGTVGLVRTIPEGLPAGSEIAILGLMGCDPRTYYPGRGPLEAIAMELDISPTDAVYRCNLIATEGETLADYSAGQISTEEARELIETLDAELSGEGVRFHAGVAYRHLMVWPDGPIGAQTCPPHDVVGRRLDAVLPMGEGADKLNQLFWRSYELLDGHEVNAARRAAAQFPGNAIWLWGQGRAASVPSLRERFGVTGSVIAAVDLVKGIGGYAGLDRPVVPGATGFVDTDLFAKWEHAMEALARQDFVAVHVEAPDEASHAGSLEDKILAIERIDEELIGPSLDTLSEMGPHRVLILPDHVTALSTRTHAADPVPFVIWPALESLGRRTARGFSEAAAQKTGLHIEGGEKLLELLLTGTG